MLTDMGVAGYRPPERLLVVEELLTKAGKIDKKALREVVAGDVTRAAPPT